MLSYIVLAIILVSGGVYSDSGCDNVKCSRVPKHYNELGCTPIKENNSCCASRYECPDKASYTREQCYWNGKAYALNEVVPDNETIGLCSVSCTCSKDRRRDDPYKFLCAQVDCPHFAGGDLVGCIKKSTIDGCCPKYMCTDEELQLVETASCEIGGIKYEIGDSIYPASEQCYGCICTKDFDNTTIVGNPSCKEFRCGIGLRYFNHIRNGCIPSYYGTESCCPNGWRCPQDSDIIIPTKSRSLEPVDPKFQCQFGKLTLSIGDEIKSDNECDVCKCITPPMPHCVQSPNCKS